MYIHTYTQENRQSHTYICENCACAGAAYRFSDKLATCKFRKLCCEIFVLSIKCAELTESNMYCKQNALQIIETKGIRNRQSGCCCCPTSPLSQYTLFNIRLHSRDASIAFAQPSTTTCPSMSIRKNSRSHGRFVGGETFVLSWWRCCRSQACLCVRVVCVCVCVIRAVRSSLYHYGTER